MDKITLKENVGLYSEHKNLLNAIGMLQQHCKDNHGEKCLECHHYFGNKLCIMCDLGLLTTFSKDFEEGLNNEKD